MRNLQMKRITVLVWRPRREAYVYVSLIVRSNAYDDSCPGILGLQHTYLPLAIVHRMQQIWLGHRKFFEAFTKISSSEDSKF